MRNTAAAIDHKRTLRLSFLVALVGLIVVAAAVFRSVDSFSKNAAIETNWQESKQAAELGALSMERLNALIGYGGLIHNFKNYVLRQDERYLLKVIDQYDELETVALRYLSQPYVSEEERVAYTAVLGTMALYKEHIFVAQAMFEKGAAVKEVDGVVAVDDTVALDAVHTIALEWERRQEVFKADFKTFFDYLRTQNEYGLILIALLSLAVLGSVAASLGLRRVIALFEEENAGRRLAEKSLKVRTEDLERSNKDLQQFAYVASHDLRSPLRAIANLADWIEEDLEGQLEGDAGQHMAMMRSRIKRLDRLLNDLLEYSRASGKTLSSESVALSDAIDDVREILVTEESDSLVMDGPAVTLDAPRAVITTALRNLVNNALKHHDKDQKNIIIRVSEDTENYKIEVIDDGPGIPEAFHTKAFQMFTTLQARDEVEGSGMGLALVARLLQNYGGKLALQSPVANERGTNFIMTWPKQPNY